MKAIDKTYLENTLKDFNEKIINKNLNEFTVVDSETQEESTITLKEKIQEIESKLSVLDNLEDGNNTRY